MWLNRARYEVLIRAEERAEMLRLRVNQLEADLAHERHLNTGKPQRVVEFGNPLRTKPKREVTPEEQGIAQIEMGLEMFNDLGDDQAKKFGVDFTDDARVAI